MRSASDMSRMGVLAVAACATALACGGDELLLPGDGRPAAIVVIDGDNQSAQIGASLPDAIVVRVTDAAGRPVAGARVSFGVTSGSGGELSPATATTDNAGQATTRWALGTAAGMQTAEARVEAESVAPIALTAFAAAGVAARLELARGDGQTAPVGTMLPDSLVVVATDAAGNPVEGLGVSWSAADGAVSAPALATGADGRAGIQRTLGQHAGEQTTLATAAGVPGSPVTFTATATTGAAGKLGVAVQPSSVATNGQPFPEQPRVRLLDGFNNPVANAGVAVTASIEGSPQGVELSGQLTVPTNAEGVAAFSGLALTGPPGSYALRFSGASLAQVVSRSIELRPGPVSPRRSSVSVAPTSIVVIGETATLTVTLRDEFGFAVSGVTVTAASSPAGGSFAPATAASNAAGVATFTFSAAAPGQYQLSAQAGTVRLEAAATVTVTKASTATIILSDAPDPSSLFQALTVRFSVSSAVGAALDGTVTVRENEGSGICTASAAAQSCDLFLSGPGSKTLTATYAGDAIHEPSTSAPEPHQVVFFGP